MSPEDRRELIADIVAAIKEAEPKLCSEELAWVRNAIEIQNQRKALIDAIIHKSLGGLVWAFLLFVGYLGLEFLKSHGFKP